MNKLFLTLFFLSVALKALSQQVVGLDTVQAKDLHEVVISASRQGEQLLKVPVSFERLSPTAIRQTPQVSFYDAIQNIKGIQIITPSLGFKVYNARGFGHTTNVRFVQLVDGVDNQAPHVGAPIANSLGPNDLDILQVEVLPGTASAMYGMNAINGLLNLITKNPFEHQGIAFNHKTGLNNFGGSSPTFFNETNLRIAHQLGSKWAAKANFSYLRGTDWLADNQKDLNPGANLAVGLIGPDNPGRDLVNWYGDESANRRNLLVGGTQYTVSRTGYAESEIAPRGINNLKGDFALHYRPTTHLELSYNYRAAHQDNTYQRTNRFRLEDYVTQQHVFVLQATGIQMKAYFTHEQTGRSYNIRSVAENLDRSFKPDQVWFAEFASQLNSQLQQGLPLAAAMAATRSLADQGRLLPGTQAFDKQVDQLSRINNWDQGGALRVQASMLHAEFQQDLTNTLFQNDSNFQLMYGMDFRNYFIIPDGNYFINPVRSGDLLNYWKVGGFIQGTALLMDEKLKFNAVMRVEKNQYFKARLNPRLALVYSPNDLHSIRMSVQNGFRFPSIFEGFSNINSGGRKRVGGLPIMSQGIFESSYTQASITRFQRAVQRDINQNGIDFPTAVTSNADILKQHGYSYLQPEQVNSLEAGYRSKIAGGRLELDFDLHLNRYRNLIAQLDANVPRTQVMDSVPFFMTQNSTQDLYRLWTNSKTVHFNYGSTFGMLYSFGRNLTASGNVTYAKLAKAKQGDGLEDGFNTPPWIFNLAFGKLAKGKAIGFQMNYRFQASYYWESALASGLVDNFGTFDAQITRVFPKMGLEVKLGATNLTNQYYYSFLGGPAIGGFYYTCISYSFHHKKHGM